MSMDYTIIVYRRKFLETKNIPLTWVFRRRFTKITLLTAERWLWENSDFDFQKVGRQLSKNIFTINGKSFDVGLTPNPLSENWKTEVLLVTSGIFEG
jgi:hypothetical protein